MPMGLELIYHDGKVNQRRGFSLDLCYPIPSLKPLIGKEDNQQVRIIVQKRRLIMKGLNEIYVPKSKRAK